MSEANRSLKQVMQDEGKHWKAGFKDIERSEKLARLWPT